jgi:hypothetical protein
MNKVTIGLYLSPYPKQLQNKEDKNKYIFCYGAFLDHEMIIFKNNNIKYIIIPYTIDKKLISTYLENIDGLFISGNYPGAYIADEENKQHYNTLQLIMKKILLINKKRPLPVIGECYGHDLLINIIEKKNSYNDSLFKNLNLKVPLFYKKSIFLDKKYKNNISFYFLNVLFLMDNYSKTKYLKNDYNIISYLKIDKYKMIDILKHKLYPIYLSKSHTFYDNPVLKDEFLYFMKLSHEYRLLNQEKNDYKFKNYNFKTIKNIYLYEYEPKIRLYQIN